MYHPSEEQGQVAPSSEQYWFRLRRELENLIGVVTCFEEVKPKDLNDVFEREGVKPYVPDLFGVLDQIFFFRRQLECISFSLTQSQQSIPELPGSPYIFAESYMICAVCSLLQICHRCCRLVQFSWDRCSTFSEISVPRSHQLFEKLGELCESIKVLSSVKYEKYLAHVFQLTGTEDVDENELKLKLVTEPTAEVIVVLNQLEQIVFRADYEIFYDKAKILSGKFEDSLERIRSLIHSGRTRDLNQENEGESAPMDFEPVPLTSTELISAQCLIPIFKLFRFILNRLIIQHQRSLEPEMSKNVLLRHLSICFQELFERVDILILEFQAFPSDDFSFRVRSAMLEILIMVQAIHASLYQNNTYVIDPGVLQNWFTQSRGSIQTFLSTVPE